MWDAFVLESNHVKGEGLLAGSPSFGDQKLPYLTLGLKGNFSAASAASTQFRGGQE